MAIHGKNPSLSFPSHFLSYSILGITVPQIVLISIIILNNFGTLALSGLSLLSLWALD